METRITPSQQWGVLRVIAKGNLFEVYRDGKKLYEVEDEEKVSRFIVRGLLAERFAVDAAKDGNAGRVLSRTMIIEHVWDQSFDGATNIVDV